MQRRASWGRGLPARSWRAPPADRGRRALIFEPVAQQHVRARSQPVACRGAHVAQRGEILRQMPHRRVDAVARVQGWPVSAASIAGRASGMPAMPPKAIRARDRPCRPRRRCRKRRDRRDILIEPFRQLVDRSRSARRVARDGDRLDELARAQVLLAVVEKEILQRQSRAACRPGAAAASRPARSAAAGCRRWASRWRCCRRRSRRRAPGPSRSGASISAKGGWRCDASRGAAGRSWPPRRCGSCRARSRSGASRRSG